MPRKSFRNSTAHLDRLFSDMDTPQETPETHEAQRTHRTQEIQRVQDSLELAGLLDRYLDRMRLHRNDAVEDAQETHEPYTPQELHTRHETYRLNLKLKKEYRDYLAEASWKAHKSVTQYLSDLIAADIAKNSQTDAQDTSDT